jgi:hypothetical protein
VDRVISSKDSKGLDLGVRGLLGIGTPFCIAYHCTATVVDAHIACVKRSDKVKE